ncbi:MAG: Y-family DNA polymerase [Candidatus Accumulibacter sp.]|jgi:DNA polymerase V|nr:Y-family DNA polymerase [Accumulibacter sp.]
MFGLIDGNNFYASCERVFQPELRKKPLIVLSNNDGCAIARSEEAKALGVKMGQPLHKIPPRIREKLAIRSANFTLYGDMSNRVLAVLREAVPRIEPYSIDESFLDLTGIPDLENFARALRDRVHRWVGIPNCVGIGPTKTLAKLANHVAKDALRKPGSYPGELAGVADLSALPSSALDDVLTATPVGEIWGVGRRYSEKLAALKIHTAFDLRAASPGMIQKRFGVVLARTQSELSGVPCLDLEEIEPDRQQIMVSRTFGERVSDPQAIGEALATFASRAAEKLRSRGLVAGAVGIFAGSDPFHPELGEHFPQRVINLPEATGDTRAILAAIRRLQRRFLKENQPYKRAGVWLMDLARPSDAPADLFSPAAANDDSLMVVMDAINRRFGRGTVGLAASGWRKHASWGMRQDHLSRHFSTSFRDLPGAAC